ncbi:MAG: DUF433 domain-containing protein [Phycisphaerae bacterium]|nr:DUF433 domain-containing protein [Phycisphaerae bacterium]
MTHDGLLSRISIDPNTCFGKPRIRGHRIWVSLILDSLADGMTHEEVLREFPGIEDADILACIAYGRRCRGNARSDRLSGKPLETEARREPSSPW